MDNMAYLQQISTANSSQQSAQSTGLARFLNLKTAVIALVLAVILVMIVMISSMLSTSENKEQDLLVKSWYRSTFLLSSMEKYVPLMKSSDLRGLSSSLEGVLKEIILKDGQFLIDDFGAEPDSFEESDVVIDERTEITTLNETLENGRLSGTLDRVFSREFTMQVAYMISYQSELSERTETEEIKTEALKAESNLRNIYDRFTSFQDLSL